MGTNTVVIQYDPSDFIEEFEDLFCVPTYEIIAKDGTKFQIEKTLWVKCNFLKTQTQETSCTLNADKTLIKCLIEYHEHGKISCGEDMEISMEKFFSFMSFCLTLQWGELCRDNVRFLCENFDRILKTKCFHEMGSEDVIKIFEEILKLPLRPPKRYAPLVEKVWEDWADGNEEEVKNVSNTLKMALQKLNGESKITCLDVPFNKTTMPLAIMKDNADKRRLYMWDGSNWTLTDLMGKNSNLEQMSVKNFYLRYGDYMVYQAEDDRVLLQDLSNQCDHRLLLESCADFQVRLNRVFVIQNNPASAGFHVFSWDHMGRKFKKIYSHGENQANNIDYNAHIGYVYVMCRNPKKFYGFKEEQDTLKLENVSTYSTDYTNTLVLANDKLEILLQRESAFENSFYTFCSFNFGFVKHVTKDCSVIRRLGDTVLSVDRSNIEANRFETHLLNHDLDSIHKSSVHQKIEALSELSLFL